MSARIDTATASGTFSLDGETFEVENTLVAVGDEQECVLIDAPHDLGALERLVAGRRVLAVLCTHAHDDHVRLAPDAGERFGAETVLHRADLGLWTLTHPDLSPNRLLDGGEVVAVGGTELHVLHTPGHSPGSVCYYAPELETVLSGDTLFRGGPGATGRSFSDFDTIIASISERLLALPPSTRVLPGHGEATTIGDEAPHLQEWVDRGR